MIVTQPFQSLRGITVSTRAVRPDGKGRIGERAECVGVWRHAEKEVGVKGGSNVGRYDGIRC